MKVYNVMALDKIDYDFSVELMQKGCYLRKEDAIRCKEDVARVIKSKFKKEIQKYSDPEEYAEGAGLTYIEEDEDYFEVSFGFEEHHECHQVWIDELDVLE